MPRLYHRKSANGCVRCKTRRVKCDEEHPECGACRRHRVPCQYQARQTASTAHRESPDSSAAVGADLTQEAHDVQAEILPWANTSEKETTELALLHYFLTETISAFHDPIAVWKTRIPLVGLQYRFVFDALLSLSALDLYRHTFETYRPHQNASICHIGWLATADGRQHYLAGHSPEGMRRLSHEYFESAIKGQQKALRHPDKKYLEPAFMGSLAIMMIALFSLACPHEEGYEENPVVHDERLWFSLGGGCREIIRSWNQCANVNVLQSAGYFEMSPDFSNEEELFHVKHRDVFHTLLTWGVEFENITAEEQEAYEKAVSFLGLLYKGVRDSSEPTYVTGSFIASFPAKVHPPFPRLVLEGRPRALAIVGHLFAVMRLVEAQLPYYKGIAVRQIPRICDRLPQGWKAAMEWASSIAVRTEAHINHPDPPSRLEDLHPS